jgi:hypothetical protein
MTIGFIKGGYRAYVAGLSFFILAAFLFSGCGAAESAAPDTSIAPKADALAVAPGGPSGNPAIPSGPSIEIKANSPADTVRAFYERLRNRQYVAAMKLTNLRPAVEGLTEEEMKDLGVDFGQIAASIPPQMPINGEIVSGDEATVTMKMPNEKDGKMETNEIRLKKDGDSWMMLVADPDGEKEVRRQGKNYFFSLRMEVHHSEAKAMLDRINKSEGIYALQNGGKFADIDTLVAKGYLPPDISSSESTGYVYKVILSFDKSTYTAHAVPATYGKTGKLSFAMRIRKGKDPELASKDVRGEMLKN